MADKLERIYTIPLTKAYDTIRMKRANRAVKIVRDFMIRHMKSPLVVISNTLNGYIWQYSREKPPRKVKVRAIKQDDVVRVYLSDEKVEVETQKTQVKKDEAKKEAKKEEPKKETAPPKKEEASKVKPEKKESETKTPSKVESKSKPS